MSVNKSSPWRSRLRLRRTLALKQLQHHGLALLRPRLDLVLAPNLRNPTDHHNYPDESSRIDRRRPAWMLGHFPIGKRRATRRHVCQRGLI